MRAGFRRQIAVFACAAGLLTGACGPQHDEPPATRGLLDAELPPLPDGPAGLIPAFPRLPEFRFPVAMLQAPGRPDRWYLVEQEGRILSFADDPEAERTEVALDLSSRVLHVKHAWDTGLLGMAFHPSHPTSRDVFLFYVEPSDVHPAGGRTVISRFRMDAGGRRIDPASEERLLTLDAEHPSYKGGAILFGPDGYLYLSIGQNVASETRPHPSQDPTRLEGKILRIDVDGGRPYAIPPDNPFVKGGGAPEVFAWGLRNAWQLAFDPVTGRLFAGEVGQFGFEEIDLIARGGNYGWPDVEGDACTADCPPAYRAPIHAYAGPGAAVVGGAVYRGRRISALDGVYLYADFMRAEVWGLHPEGDGWRAERLLRTGNDLKGRGVVGSVTGFATGADGEMYVLTRGGRVGRLVTRSETLRYYTAIR